MTGAGHGYQYPHDHGGWVAQQYLPDDLRDRRLYRAIAGREADLQERLDQMKASSSDPGRKQEPDPAPDQADATPEEDPRSR
jgi:replication-associated recombination protein RarA